MCHALPPLHTKYISLRRSFIEWILGSAAFSWVTFPPLNLLFLKQTEYVKLWNYSKCKSWKVALFSFFPPLFLIYWLCSSPGNGFSTITWLLQSTTHAIHPLCYPLHQQVEVSHHEPHELHLPHIGSFLTKEKKITNIQNFHMLPRAFFFSSSKLNTCQKKIWEDAKFANEI